MINPMTRQRIHIHHEAGLTYRRIAELTETSVRSVQRVLDEPMPSPAELAVGRLTRPHGGRPVVAVPCVDRLTALLQERVYSSGITGNGSGLARGIFGVYALTSRCLDSRPGLGVDHACPISCVR